MQGKHVLLTGATGGLGLGVTPAVLAAQPAEVTIPYTSDSHLQRLLPRLSTSDQQKLRAVSCNLMDEQEVSHLIQSMSRVDVLIHLVGGFAMGKTHEYSYENWRKDFDLNLNTAFLVCKYSLARMWEQGYGRIVTIGSRGAVQPGAQLAAYCASKAGVVALTQAIAAETKGSDITANCVLPSLIDTPSNREAMGSDQADQWVKPESLAPIICFLASEAARDIRGAAIPAYGNI
jgi:NAD(P)-dependent dehydrogenase (short-subunit alcohol dehydrogenase family)